MKLYFVLFVLMCMGQWYVPVSMIAREESVLRNGKIFHFRTAPVDPTDPFRGKYITLNFDAEMYTNPGGEWRRDQKVFVAVEPGADGFADIVNVSVEAPGPDVDYFTAEVYYSNDETLQLRFPFRRFYLEESKASGAEDVYRDSTQNDETEAYAIVRIREGKATLEDVMVGNRSIVDVVREMNDAEE